MIRLFFTSFFLVLAISGISQKNKPNGNAGYIKRYDYRIEINTWNDYPVFTTTYILDNRFINFPDSADDSNGKFKPMVLYYIGNNSVVDKADTIRVSLTKKDADSLFNLTSKFFQTFQISNIDSLTNDKNAISIINDDVGASFELSLGERKLSATVYSISNPRASTKDLKYLLNYIKQFPKSKGNSR